jgi:hypothetical protein
MKKYCDNNGAQLLKVDNEQEHEYIRTRISGKAIFFIIFSLTKVMAAFPLMLPLPLPSANFKLNHSYLSS